MSKTKQEYIYEEKINKRKEKVKKHTFLYYMNPANLYKEVEGYGYSLDLKNILVYFLIYSASAIGLSIVLNMQLVYILILYLSGLIFIPQLVVNSYKLKYVNNKYADANTYIEQLLYAFLQHKNIVAALNMIKVEFTDSKMYDCIENAIDYILAYHDQDIEDVELEGLKIIENEYPLKKISTVHKFLRKIEMIGGDFTNSINLLQEDRSKWEKRILGMQKEKQMKKTKVLGAIIVSSIVVVIFTVLLKNMGFDITHNIAVQSASVIMWFLNMLVLTIADKKINVSEFDDKEAESEENVLRQYYKIVNWDNSKQFKKSLIYAVIPLALVILCIFFNKTIGLVLSLILLVFMLLQHKVDYKVTLKACNRNIENNFPDWLMEIALLLQFENVYVSIVKSYDNAPTILKPEIKKLCEEVQNSPNSIEPYLEFMKDFDTTSIRSTMKMLYSISVGIGGSADEQIVEIIRKNNQMIDKTNEYNDDNSLASYLVMFWLPGMFAGGKLIVDMLAFMILSMTDMSVFLK